MKVEKSYRKTGSDVLKTRSLTKVWLFYGILFISFCFIPHLVFAASEKFVLDFNNSYYHGRNRETTTLFLKRTLKQQYPWLRVKNLSLRKAVLIAKSRGGRGRAQLLVGNNASRPERVGGIPSQYHDNRAYSFDRVAFRNPSVDSDGRWQIDLQGNLVVSRVVLIMDDNRRYYNNRRYSMDRHKHRGRHIYRW